MGRESGQGEESRAELGRRLDDVLAQQRELIARLRDGQDYFQRLARSVWRVQEDERRRLARELHDGVGHSLTALLHLMTQAGQSIGERPDEARERLERAREVAETTLRETRELSRLLRPQILDDLGLESALRWLARSFQEHHRIEVALDVDDPLPDLGGDLSTLVFRIIQEALTNVARHSGAKRVDVVLHAGATQVAVSIRDDGRGCAKDDAIGSGARGSGLGGLRDRARLFGGVLGVESGADAGFAVAARFPLAAGAEGGAS